MPILAPARLNEIEPIRYVPDGMVPVVAPPQLPAATSQAGAQSANEVGDAGVEAPSPRAGPNALPGRNETAIPEVAAFQPMLVVAYLKLSDAVRRTVRQEPACAPALGWQVEFPPPPPPLCGPNDPNLHLVSMV